MSRFEEKRIAHTLRKQGRSITSIAKQLGVSKSSVSLWCRDIKLTSIQQQRLKQNSFDAGNKGRIIGAEINRQKRLNSIELYKKQGQIEIGELSDRDLTMLATALFWAEGAKTGSRFIFINSDPSMIVLMVHYLTKVLKIDRERITATIQINHIHKNRIESVYDFWSSLLKLPIEHFGKPYYINVVPKKKYQNHDLYNGILRLRVNRGSGLQYKLLGYINALKL